MMALGFAMVATATAGTVVHADDVAPARPERAVATATRTPPAAETERAGFYESLTRPVRR